MKLLKLIKDQTNVDFMKPHKLFLCLSAGLMILTLVLLFTRGLNLGIDFTGGIMLEIGKPAGVSIEQIRTDLSGISERAVSIQEFGSDEIMIKIPGAEANVAQQKALQNAVNERLGGNIDFRRTEYVGPQVGSELIKTGVMAFGFSMLGIMAYVWARFEWQFGITSLMSLIHDVLLTLLFFIVTRIEFDLSTVAAVLMVAGYSINDTIVVFDRIRELLRKYRKMPLAELLNLAVNQTLSRTLLTGVATILALIALAVFGGAVIQSFTLALLVGIIVGVYSSIYIAAPVLMYLDLPRAPTEEKEAVSQRP